MIHAWIFSTRYSCVAVKCTAMSFTQRKKEKEGNKKLYNTIHIFRFVTDA
jgi:hypothetical protein